MIRTEAVKLVSIKGLAFKQKLTAGGAGITIVTPEDRAVFTINKRDGSCAAYGPVNGEVFTAAIAAEAIELTQGLPYRRLGKITRVYDDCHCDETSAELEAEDSITLKTREYDLQAEDSIRLETDRLGVYYKQWEGNVGADGRVKIEFDKPVDVIAPELAVRADNVPVTNRQGGATQMTVTGDARATQDVTAQGSQVSVTSHESSIASLAARVGELEAGAEGGGS